METQEQKTPVRDIVLRTISVLGLIAVLLLGAWGIIQLAAAVPSLFSNVGGGVSNIFTPGPQKETLSVTANQSVVSGQNLEVSWNHQNKSGEYAYTLSYACQSGLSLKAPVPTGSYQTVACNTPFNFVNASGKMTLIPTANKTLPLAITVSATKLSSGAVTAQGSATVSVTAGAANAAAPAAKASTATASKGTSNTGAYYAAPAPKSLYGYADLAVSINSVTPTGNGLTAITFTIQNTGTNNVPSGWVFNATLPINGSYTFNSQSQRALGPGDKVVYTLTYSGGYGGANYPYYTMPYGYSGPSYYSGPSNYVCNGFSPCFATTPSHDPIDYPNVYNYGYGGPVSITADPYNQVMESSEFNNTVTTY